ncbi:homocysteine biosynthesis protein [Candidatus Fermentibacterales bacterium]|nr:homocysteine biosynthesis protein [Candidatus Fermentibacterales bacterium]
MRLERTWEEINEKLRAGSAVVVTAEEMAWISRSEGIRATAGKVDVVTTGTFGPMCSSGAFLNVGHTSPRIKLQKAWLNDVPAYAGLAAVDVYIGATSLPEGDPANSVFPGRFAYGGGHVIEDLVAGKSVLFRGEAYGGDCYPRRSVEAELDLASMGDAILVNPRNAYQNYNVAVNASIERPIYTYLGILRPGAANAGFSSAGQLSPLLNDPLYRTIGLGSRILLGGGEGYVCFHGTQHDPDVRRNERGVPMEGAGTICVAGDLKGMRREYVRGVSIRGYGVSLAVGIAVPVPILDEQMAAFTSVSDEDILAPVVDYGSDYPEHGGAPPLGMVSYAELRSGCFELRGKRVRCSSISSYPRARAIAGELRDLMMEGRFLLSRPVAPLPGAAGYPGGRPA